VPLDGRSILLAGGYTDSGFTASTLLYDTAADEYRPAPPLPLAVAGMVLVRGHEGVLAIGGEHRMRARTPRVLFAAMPR
jgi:N-acetylneuraminic acid mutarotase